ncbi:MAG: queuosine precursor transporter [Candidatus Peribacteraceae bacterium]|nr:queuosine precursor transporter [Candidatus Peribacteraceae bacterium]
MRSYRFFDVIMAAFVAVLLISNIASSAKIVDFGVSLYGMRLSMDGGTLLFPLSYIFGDILTEVYGFARSRRVIWAGFAASALMSLTFFALSRMPGDAQWMTYAGDEKFGAILGGVSSGGIIVASLLAYFAGEFSNSYVLAKMKVRTEGKWLWARTIGSTLVGEGIDTLLFIAAASVFGVFPWTLFWSLTVANYIFKVGIEVIFTPVTYAVVRRLKKVEQEDFYDRETNFNPFRLSRTV